MQRNARQENLIGIYIPKLRVLRPLLESWVQSVLRYCDIHAYEDNSWWFNERASLSTLAGAAWSLPGWAALEEFSTRKRGDVPSENVEEGSLRSGRCDLYVCNKKHGFAFEAKQAWQSIGERTDGLTYVHKGMRMAWKDAGKPHKTEADHRMAATFIVPFVPGKDAVKRDPLELVQDWLNTKPFSLGGRAPASYAYVFPSKWKEFRTESNSRIFPGVALILEERLRTNRTRARSS